LIAAGSFGAMFAILVSLIIWALKGRDNLPQVTRERLSSAIQTWQRAGVQNYDLEILVSVQQEENHRVAVRNGVVQSYQRNGRPMSGRRTFDTWSVPGMLGTIEQDLEHVEAIAEGKQSDDTPRLSLWGQFDPQYGYPVRYRRVQWGTNIEVTWRVVHFNILDASNRGLD
jgi:hypothetical protein